jgi:hypothetical protein
MVSLLGVNAFKLTPSDIEFIFRTSLHTLSHCFDGPQKLSLLKLENIRSPFVLDYEESMETSTSNNDGSMVTLKVENGAESALVQEKIIIENGKEELIKIVNKSLNS